MFSQGKFPVTGECRGGDGNDDDVDQLADDEFEMEMERELQRRADDAQRIAGVSTSAVKASSSSGGGKREGDQVGEEEKYDDVYFDTDEEEEEEDKAKRKRLKPTDDDLLYDPDQDDDDQRWVDDLRRSYLPKDSATAARKRNAKDGVRALPNSDAVLNCPACFAVVCLDCQRHEVYTSQYRAMFVVNCSVDETQKLKFPLKGKKKKKKTRRDDGEAASTSTEAPNDDDESYNPVKCEQCSTEVAVYDKDEIYHFFNVIASH